MKALIFDIDGTLLQSAVADDTMYRDALVEVLGPVTFRGSLHDYEHVSDSGILAQVLLDNGLRTQRNLAAEIRTKFVAAMGKHIATHGPFEEIPGARQFFARAKASPDHYVALATGGWQESAAMKLRSAAFDVADITLSSSDEEPDRARIMLAALDRPESQYDSITYYGDGPWDRDACARLGWDFVAVGERLGGLQAYD